MTITLNGENKEVNSATIAELFQELDIPRRGRVVHVNGKLIHWTKYEAFQLNERDDVGVIRGIAGG